MKLPRNSVPALLIAIVAAASIALAMEGVFQTGNGLLINDVATDKLGFYGTTPVTQPTSSSQAAITDNTGGTASTTLAAGDGVNTITIPLTSLATGLSTSAIDLLTNYTPGYKFKVLSFAFVTTVVGTGTSASQTFNLEIGTTNVTGGSLNVTLASTNAIGAVTSATAITAANTGTSTDTISIEMAASGTVFTAGAGYFVIRIQNMDTADAIASLARLQDAMRTGVVNLGLLKGS